MAQVVELEGAASARKAGESVTLDAEESTLVSDAGSRRKALYLFNNGEEDIWIRFAPDGNDGEGTGIPMPKGTGLVIKEYFGAICAWSEKASTLHIAEF